MGRLLAGLLVAMTLSLALWLPPGVGPGADVPAAMASPGLCTGSVCGDEIGRSAKYHWQLQLRVGDQRGHSERIVVDCRFGVISPLAGPVNRAYVSALVQRVCRFAGESMEG